MFSVWTILLTILAIELVLNSILVLPIPFIRRPIIGFLRLLFKSATVQTASIIIAILLLYSFAMSYYTANRLTGELEHDENNPFGGVMFDAAKEHGIRSRIFREQRNMYLSGFSFFHGIVLWRLIKLFDQFKENKEAIEHADSQPATGKKKKEQ